MGPIEHESLAALAERGFRFSLDNVADLRIEPRDLASRGFRFVKVPGELAAQSQRPPQTDIHPADLSDLLGRFGIDLIAEKIESEGIGGRPARLRRALRPGLPVLAAAAGARRGAARHRRPQRRDRARYRRRTTGAGAAHALRRRGEPAGRPPADRAPPAWPARPRRDQPRTEPRIIRPSPANDAPSPTPDVRCAPPFTSHFATARRRTTTSCSATSGASCTTASLATPRSLRRARALPRAGRHRGPDHQCAAAGRGRGAHHARPAQGAARPPMTASSARATSPAR